MVQVTPMETYPVDESGFASPALSHDSNHYDLIDGHTGQKLEVFAVQPDARGSTALQVGDDLGQGLEVLVIYTGVRGTLAALRMADGLARKLGAHIRLLLPYEVPYALPLTKPAVPVEFLENQVRELASTIHLGVAAQILLCRDKRRTLGLLLRPDSLVVVGGRTRWWPTAAQRLAQAVQKDGHSVIFAELR